MQLGGLADLFFGVGAGQTVILVDLLAEPKGEELFLRHPLVPAHLQHLPDGCLYAWGQLEPGAKVQWDLLHLLYELGLAAAFPRSGLCQHFEEDDPHREYVTLGRI